MAYTKRPLKRDESKQLLLIDFPPDATDIQFAEYSEFIAYGIVVSFRAPPESCASFARSLIAEFNKRYPEQRIPIELEPVHDLAPQKPRTSEITAPWFRSESIDNGYVGGAVGSHQPKIWIDMDRGIFTYELTD